MKYIFLDDDNTRWARFQSAVPQAFRAATAAECINMINNSPHIEWLFLDHDLGGETYVDSSREDCGMEVVRHLCANPRVSSINNIVVHSHNSVAAATMCGDLHNAGYKVRYVPFSNLIGAISSSSD